METYPPNIESESIIVKCTISYNLIGKLISKITNIVLILTGTSVNGFNELVYFYIVM